MHCPPVHFGRFCTEEGMHGILCRVPSWNLQIFLFSEKEEIYFFSDYSKDFFFFKRGIKFSLFCYSLSLFFLLYCIKRCPYLAVYSGYERMRGCVVRLDLQELLDWIRKEQDSFPAAQRRVASYVVENYQQIAFLSISALSSKIGVSDNTVVKFCNHLGYSKFAEFKKEFTNYAHSELLIYNKIDGNTKPDDGNVWMQMLNDTTSAIQATLTDPVNVRNLPLLLERIEKAQHIYITGGRISGAIAAMFVSRLRYLNLQVHALKCDYVGDFVDQTAVVRPEDLVIAVSFPRYTTQIVNAMEYLHQRGVPIALITDKGLSPIYPYADVVFHCATESSGFLPCYTGSVALIDAICQAISIAHRAEITSYVHDLEKRLLEQGVWM